jgi:hypothetical protein
LRGNLLNLTNAEGQQSIVDTYYILNRNGDQPTGRNDTVFNKTAPILCLVSESFFLFATDRKAVYETSLTWNETFSKNYPNIYQQLVGSISR